MSVLHGHILGMGKKGLTYQGVQSPPSTASAESVRFIRYSLTKFSRDCK